MINTTAMDATLTATTGAVNRMTQVIEDQSVWNWTIHSLPSENMGRNLEATANPELAIPLHQVVGPEQAVRVRRRNPLSIEPLVWGPTPFVDDRSVHGWTAVLVPGPVNSTEASGVVLPTATGDHAEVRDDEHVFGHGTKGITSCWHWGFPTKEHAP